MAFRKKMDLEDLTEIYNVSMAVGAAAANKGDDVMLVQFLLHYSGFEAHYHPYSVMPLPDLKIDGKPSKLLASKISFFQMEMKRKGLHIKTDGRVDRAYDSWNNAGDAMYTIIYLNRMMKKNRPWEYENLDKWGDTPSLLKKMLQRK